MSDFQIYAKKMQCSCDFRKYFLWHTAVKLDAEHLFCSRNYKVRLEKSTKFSVRTEVQIENILMIFSTYCSTAKEI